ncbi:MAG: LacI family DNA-binding transcriptional regulator, partial [Spongiibacteraceae bacterium]|nr:LacI family DNA-binding transcriptional regulator [Spongiibacteraceae bacterium]
MTIHDVAALAGLSIKTVSRVINREPNVKESTAQRVQQAIEQLDYRPNLSARNLAGRRAFLVVLVYDNPSDAYVVALQQGALEVCRELGYSLVLHPTDISSPVLIDDLLTLVRDRNPTGLVLTPPVCDMPGVIEALDAESIAYTTVTPADES